MSVIVTGVAGFIGFHVAKVLLERGEAVIGLDNLNDYYDPTLKQDRLSRLQRTGGFTFHKLDVSDREALALVFNAAQPVRRVLHLAAQAGVRHARIDPYSYVTSNVMGQLAMMEAARHLDQLDHFVYASSSSVYGGNDKLPFSTDDRVDHPVSLYAATKRSGELMAESYSHLYRLPMTGLRFFTVYGPWGRPDMAYFKFAKAITEGEPITVFNRGNMKRDFTYIDDVVQGVLAALDRPPADNARGVPHQIYNLGNNRCESLLRFIELLERACGREARKIFEEKPADDVLETFADITEARRNLGYAPRTSIEEGLPRFVDWFRAYYRAGVTREIA